MPQISMQLLRSTADPKTFFWLWCGAGAIGLGSGLLPLGWVVPLLLAGVGGILSLWWPRLPELRFWLLAGALGGIMHGYFLVRLPKPQAEDISIYAPQRQALLQAEVTEDPKINRRGTASVLVRPLMLVAPVSAQPQGLLYVRVPVEVVDKLYPGVHVELLGVLREARPATNPGQFDFKEFLARRGVFATFAAEQVTVLSQPQNWLTSLRRRLVGVHREALGSPRGELLTSLVVGSGAVALDPGVQDRFTRVGLAHLLAASGAQVALVVGTCLALLSKRSIWLRVGVTGGVLLGYLLVAGGSPSILRAGVMGAFALVSLVWGNKGESVQVWALAAVGFLVCNPLWMVDVGFQLSFLATLGLVVTVPRLSVRFSFLPSVVAVNLAVALAAYVWTLPVQLLAFGQLSPYALPANLFAVIGIEGLTLGGFLSSLVGLVWPGLAGVLDIPLGWGLSLLLALVDGLSGLPGSTLYPGALSLLQVCLLYLLLGMLHFPNGLSARPWAAGGVAGVVLFLPGSPAVQFTVLDAGPRTAILESEGRVLVLSDGRVQTIEAVVIPYLRAQGHGRVDSFIGLGPVMEEGLERLERVLPIQKLWLQAGDLPGFSPQPVPLLPERILRLGPETFARVLRVAPLALVLQTKSGRVLYCGSSSAREQRQLLQRYQPELTKVDWIWTENSLLIDPWFALPSLRGVLVSAPKLAEKTAQAAQQRGLPLFWTQERGALTWTGSTTIETVQWGY
ncbi:ComEC/Rec2 family competence protein [Anthocerotibacter panamensis]|uniref:ComEC/Rec2 family competence protein n=1 Tax=Anthocerotibacter panamensis TaxID=2857077 RepID=UPI001C405326|nr:ComEC/Rec2 family competence protein [Anthocerotibacter panamensis]